MSLDFDDQDPNKTGRVPVAGSEGTGRLARAHRVFVRVATALSAAMFAALFLTFVAQIFWRYVLNSPLVWTLEVAGLLFVTVSLFTAATQMPFRDHVALDLLVEAVPRRLGGILRALSLIAFGVVMLLSVPDTVRVLEWMYGERTFALRLNLGHLFVLMIVFVVIYALRAFWEAWGHLRGTSERDAP